MDIPTTVFSDLISAGYNMSLGSYIAWIDLCTMTDSNNPLKVAEKMVATNGHRMVICGVGNNSGQTATTPYGYTNYIITQRSDTIVVRAYSFNPSSNEVGKVNARTRTGSWTGWKII